RADGGAAGRGWAFLAAGSAIVGVGVQAQARAATQRVAVVTNQLAFGVCAGRRAVRGVRAHLSAGAAVGRIGRPVDAGAAAVVRAARAIELARAPAAHLIGPAGVSAGAAIGGIVAGLDAGAVAAGVTRVAQRLAAAARAAGV